VHGLGAFKLTVRSGNTEQVIAEGNLSDHPAVRSMLGMFTGPALQLAQDEVVRSNPFHTKLFDALSEELNKFAPEERARALDALSTRVFKAKLGLEGIPSELASRVEEAYDRAVKRAQDVDFAFRAFGFERLRIIPLGLIPPSREQFFEPPTYSDHDLHHSRELGADTAGLLRSLPDLGRTRVPTSDADTLKAREADGGKESKGDVPKDGE
jgi:hypothetical protein